MEPKLEHNTIRKGKTKMKNDLTIYNEYTDTSKLTDDIMNLLTEYKHDNTEAGVTKMLDTYFKNKHDLIELFKKSPNYKGDLRIEFEEEFERKIDSDAVIHAVNELIRNPQNKKLITKTEDEEGKTRQDYILKLPKHYDLSELATEDGYNKMKEETAFLNNFNHDGYTMESITKWNHIETVLDAFRLCKKANLDTSDVDYINTLMIGDTDKPLMAEGMKTSRAMNKVCKFYGLDKTDDYNKLFAAYADTVSEKNQKMKVVISVNPYDYLTMSFGVNWASCHTIDKTNKRNMANSYSGMYCGGTMSYMLDGTSMIMYIVKENDNVQTAGKIYRNMFHWNGHNLLQGRIYPQGNDGAVDLYSKFRGIVQKEFSAMLGLDRNKWIRNQNPGALNIISNGSHYQDYYHFSDCSYSYPEEYGSNKEKNFEIGHATICVKCGNKGIADSGRLNHTMCRGE